jgi:hypothetical protein
MTPKTKKVILISLLVVAALIVWGIIVAIIVSVANSRGQETAEFDMMGISGGGVFEEAIAPAATLDAKSSPAPSPYVETAISSGRNSLTEQQIIKSGRLDLEVTKISEALDKISSLLAEVEGFISNSDIRTRDDETQYGTVTLRVPVKEFEKTVAGLKKIAKVVNSENISGVDVTEEFVDMEARLKNLRIEEGQYQEILKRAVKIEDILKVNEYLFNVRGEIEGIEGRIKYLSNLTDLATIEVSLSEEPTIKIPTSEWRPLNTIKTAFSAMLRMAQGFVSLLIWLVFIGLPIAVVIWAIIAVVKFFRKRRTMGGE